MGWTEVYDGRTDWWAGWEGYQRPRSHDWAGRVSVGLFFALWWFCFCWLIAIVFMILPVPVLQPPFGALS